jgi:hypothetical protein
VQDAAPAVATATWEAASVAAVTLSGGNLVATNTGTSATEQGAKVASAGGKASGKYYFEVTVTNRAGGGNVGIGVGTYASTYSGMGQSGGVVGTEWYTSSGNVWSSGSNLGAAISWVGGIVCGLAIDLDNRKFWIRNAPSGDWDGTPSHNPATNTGGYTIPAGTMVPYVTFGGTSGVAGNVFTANFGASAFVGAVPSSYTAGWPV